MAGAITTMVLCDNGADVIKVESPDGDPDRQLPAFAQWHRGKKSVVADLMEAEGRSRARDLAAEADVLVQSWLPGTEESLGLGYGTLAVANPRLVYCSITGFGPKGPFAQTKGYDPIVAAKAGVMAYDDGDRPRYAAIPGGTYGAAHGALQGILSALFVVGNGGSAQRVDTRVVQGLTGYAGLLLPGLEKQREAGTTFTPISGIVCFTKDGRWLQFANFRPHLVAAFLEATGLTNQYRAAVERGDAAESVREIVLRRIHERTLDEWMDVFLRSDDIGVEPFRTPLEALNHPQALHNGQVVDVVDPRAGKTRQLGPLVSLERTPASIRHGAPGLGEHTDTAAFAARGPAGANAVPPVLTRSDGGPLAGVTVVELAWFFAAPFGTALLADLGARVIKVESADGDPHRYQNPLREFSGVKALQGKESVVVDYRTPEGKEILHRLVASADMVMRNYRQQHSVQTGDDYASLRSVNPDQVYLYAGAYGSDGPYATRPAFAPSMSVAAGQRAYQLGWAQALDRTEEITFDDGMRRLAKLQTWSGGPSLNGDAAAALTVGTAMLLGLVARQRTGIGQYLQTTMLCSNAYVVSHEFFDYDGHEPIVHHDENGVGPLYRLYPASDGWVFLAAPVAAEWLGLCAGMLQATGVNLEDDPRFLTSELRRVNAPSLAETLGALFGLGRAAEWEETLATYDVACAEVSRMSLAEFALHHPAMTDNGFVETVEHPLFGEHPRSGPIATLSATPGVVRPACLVGEHTKHVLRGLGYSDEQLWDLRARGVVTWPDDAG